MTHDLNPRPRTSGEYSYSALRQAILTGQLEAGERIVQSDWASSLGVSITPIREAIRRLQAEGLVDVEAHRGTMVTGLSREDGQDIYQLRLSIDPFLVAPGIRAFTPEKLKQGTALCKAMGRTREPDEFAELNQEFHDLLAEGAPTWSGKISSILRAAAAPYVALTLRTHPDQLAASNAEHYAMLTAYETKDLAGAELLVQQHLRTTLRIINEVLPR